MDKVCVVVEGIPEEEQQILGVSRSEAGAKAIARDYARSHGLNVDELDWFRPGAATGKAIFMTEAVVSVTAGPYLFTIEEHELQP